MIRRRRFATFVVLAACLILALVACQDDESGDENTPSNQDGPPRSEGVPATVASTPPPRITRIITPGPTSTPRPTPTLSYDLVPVMGPWAARVQLEIRDSAYVDLLRYYAVLSLEVYPDGSVSGSGVFTQHLEDDVCDTRVLDNAGMAFILQGTTRPVGDVIWVDAEIIPEDINRKENYAVICPETYNDVRYRNEPILWRMLLGLNERRGDTVVINKLNWSFALMNAPAYAFESNLPQETGGTWDGYLTGSFQLFRN